MGFVGLSVLIFISFVAGSSIRSGTAAERANAWLLIHKENPDIAGMNDLKASDPNAYAMVEALLTKRSLGLLHPDTPAASFSHGARVHSFKEDAQAGGLLGPPHSKAAFTELPYPSVGVEHVKDPFSYHPGHDGVAKVESSRSLYQKEAKPPVLQISSLRVSQTKWTDSVLAEEAAGLAPDMMVPGDISIKGVHAETHHHLPIVPPSFSWRNPRGLEDTVPRAGKQLGMGQQSSYATAGNAQEHADLAASVGLGSFHKLAQTLQTFTNAQYPLSSRTQSKSTLSKEDDGSADAKALAAAKSNQWKSVLEFTDSSKSDGHQPARTLAEMAQEDLDLDDHVVKSVQQRPGKALLNFLKIDTNSTERSIASMVQASKLIDKPAPEEDDGAKLKHWLKMGQGKEASSMKSANPYLSDLKGAVPKSLNLLVPENVVIQSSTMVEDDGRSNLDHWLDRGKKEVPVNQNPYMIDLKSA
eukprot:gnl/MRDRNA2_/MRDRNA2_99807_c0_seq1.p1 gnl/MRDRNA2_/MRDRNA2_99807_c0~~gnl/MRDRNA2_/MRDRNA2_99807_c0_seq1.p1  ORF type:complete len:471 (-),score=102.06 gnl/MRDRNA2_/MRDRNA2_99807_c0_seq1:41-1453(-)